MDEKISNVRIDLELDGVSLENQFVKNSGKKYFEAFDDKMQKIKGINIEELNKITKKLIY